MKYLLVLLAFLGILGLHDYALYTRFQRKAISDLNECIDETIKDMKKENPARDEKYFERMSGAIIIDCHHETLFHYLYPRTQGILVYHE